MVLLTAAPAVLIARQLGPDGVGAYATAARFCAVLLSFVSLSYAHGLAQLAASRSPELTGAWRGALLLSAPQALIAAGLLYLGAAVVGVGGGGENILLMCFGLALLLQFPALSGQHILRGSGDFTGFNSTRLFSTLLFASACGVLSQWNSLSLETIGASWLTAQLLYAVLVWRRLVRRKITPTRPAELSYALRYGLHAHTGVFGRDISSYLDQLIVVFLLGECFPWRLLAGIHLLRNRSDGWGRYGSDYSTIGCRRP